MPYQMTFNFLVPSMMSNFNFSSSPLWWSSYQRTWSTYGTPPSPRSSTHSSSTVITIERLPFRFVEENHLFKRKVQIGDFCDWHLNSGPWLPASKILRMGLGDPVHKRASKQAITRLESTLLSLLRQILSSWSAPTMYILSWYNLTSTLRLLLGTILCMVFHCGHRASENLKLSYFDLLTNISVK